ncbi:MAG: biopolymer transporter ExbD [Candidatus Eisenbacteria bacterium]|jgi:biopolymer transport protein ExbD|nr:biopolymer transporter ExbD [Candidatus Eisenbacteria bacterium]
MVFTAPRRQNHVVVNITPLVDVLFLLIIFFTVAGTFKRTGQLELRLPDSTTSVPAAAAKEGKEVELVLTEAGALLLDGSRIEPGELGGRLRTLRGENPDGRVTIKAETGVRHGQVVELLDTVRTAGFPGVALATLRVMPEGSLARMGAGS